MIEPSPLQFFRVVLRPPASVVVALAALVSFSGWLAWSDPGDVDQTVVLALFFQMFSAAHGFRERAVRGHFDTILGFGRSRASTAAAHWLVAVLPGAIAWMLVSMAIFTAHRTFPPTSLTVSALAAFVYVSCAAWAVALPFPRYTSGVLWTLALVLLAGFGRIDTLRAAFVGSGHGWAHALARASAAAACPVLLLANADATDWACVAIIMFAAALFVLAGVWFISTLDAPLRDPSW